MKHNKCVITDCDGLGRLNKNGKRYFIKGYCLKHYKRWYKHGDASKVTREYDYIVPMNLYMTWATMKTRCYNPNAINFHNYGGRGIAVCDRWKNSYTNFYNDMGDKPSSKHSIDRIDNDGDYSPENCRWATRVEQNNNQRPRNA